MGKWLIGLVLLAAACGDSTGPQPSISGTWSGSVVVTLTSTQTLTITVVESGGIVSGSGTLSNTPTGTRALVVNGTYSSPNFSATLSSGSAQPVNLQARIDGQSMSGNLSGSGFIGESITLARTQ